MGLGPERVAGAFEEDGSQPRVELCDIRCFRKFSPDAFIDDAFPVLVQGLLVGSEGWRGELAETSFDDLFSLGVSLA
jgi:hypothetical protein